MHEVAQSKGNPKIVLVFDCCPSHYARVVLDKNQEISLETTPDSIEAHLHVATLGFVLFRPFKKTIALK